MGPRLETRGTTKDSPIRRCPLAVLFAAPVLLFWVVSVLSLAIPSARNAGGFRAPLTRRSFRDVFPFSSVLSDNDLWKKSSTSGIKRRRFKGFPNETTP